MKQYKLFLKFEVINRIMKELKDDCERTPVICDDYRAENYKFMSESYWEFDPSDYYKVFDDFDESLPGNFESLPKDLKIEIKAYWHDHNPVFTFPIVEEDLELAEY